MKEVAFLHFDVYDTSAFGFKRPDVIIKELGIGCSWMEISSAGNYFKLFEPVNLPSSLPEQMSLHTLLIDDDEYLKLSSKIGACYA